MNLYQVIGQVQTNVDNIFDGMVYAPVYEYSPVALFVEAQSTEGAPNAALLKLKEDDEFNSDYEWKDRTTPSVELVREISEAEMMERAGAPKLF